jgi:poly-gamma-glutamate capsule biosynthesis protein CapA/YwtB (metallophosphatase superfamily)
MQPKATRALVATALLVGSIGGALAIAPVFALGSPSAAKAPVPLRLTAKLPEWLAPEAHARTTGWAGADEPVRLLANGKPIAAARSGALGRFMLDVRAPRRSGRYRLVLRAGDRRTVLPDLIVRPVVLAAVGDVNLGDRIDTGIRTVGPDGPWKPAAPVLRAADLTVANLECAVSTRGWAVPGKEYTFRGAPSSLAAAGRAGVDVVSVANNHSLDFGVEAFVDTLRHARRFGLQTIGGGTLGAARRATLVRLGGLRIALLAYSDVRPAGFDATIDQPGAAPAVPEAIAVDVAAARRRADSVVVYFHWGNELEFTPNEQQRSLAAVALAAGATVVLGAHPHVLQPVELRGRQLVAWSLGNFVFGAASPGTTSSGVLLVGLERRGVRWSELVPARIDGFTPVPDGRRMEKTLARLRRAQLPS